MKKIKFQCLIQKIFWVVLVLGLVGCSTGITNNTPLPDEPIGITEPAETPEEIEATPTTLPAQPTVILVIGEGADQNIVSQTQTALELLTTENDQVLEVQESLSAEMLLPNVRIVIGIGPNLDLSGLAGGAPDVSFVAIDNPLAVSGANLSVIGDPIIDVRRQAFMAGYLSAIVSNDNKITALFPSDIDNLDLIVESYVIGARFYCGNCRPQYPPYNPFPQWQTISSEIGIDEFRSIVENYRNIGVEILYLPGVLASPEKLTFLADTGVRVIGDTIPDVARNNWVGTITTNPDDALAELWPDLMAGTAGVQVPANITLIDTEAGLVTEGRWRLYNIMIADLEAGLVSPGAP
jgi:hypothetical protein